MTDYTRSCFLMNNKEKGFTKYKNITWCLNKNITITLPLLFAGASVSCQEKACGF